VRRLPLLLAGAALWLFLLAIPAFADAGPHIQGQFSATPAECAGCHRAHSGTAPDLLKQAMPNLCYSCHGAGATGSILDVQDGAAFSPGQAHVAGATAGSFAGALRGGGFDYALINTADQNGSRLATIGVRTAGVATSSNHSVDGSAVTMWGAGANSPTSTGGTADVALTCGSCHDQHGNGQYRILRETPHDTAGVAGSNIVQINDVTSKVYTTTNYGQAGTFNSNDSQALNANGSSLQYDYATQTWTGTFAEASSRWCTTCHTRYMGFRGSAGNLTTTSGGTGDAVFPFKHASRNLVDPNNPGAASSGVLTPVNTGAFVDPGVSTGTLLPGAVIGCYASGAASATQIIYRGVAVLVGTSSSGPNDCTYYGTGTLSNRSGLAGSSTGRDPLTTISSGAPRCISCHVSHGSPALMSTLITSQTSPGIDQGGTPFLDSTLLRLDQRGVCMACHNMNQ
jgi:predicted CXXCH cytochrome family protein